MADVRSHALTPGSSAWVAGIEAASGALTREAENLELVLADRRERARRLHEASERLTVEAASDLGDVRVRVNAAGEVTGLDLDESVLERESAAELAAEILKTMRRAQQRITDQVRPLVAETLGDQSATGRAILARYEVRYPKDADQAGELRRGSIGSRDDD